MNQVKTILTRDEREALDFYVHTPAETATGYVKFADEIRTYPGITFGCSLDDHLIPIRPGRVLGLLARPGHMKTTFGGYLVMREAEKIQERGDLIKYAIHVSWEQPVEELEAMYQRPIGYNISDVAWGRVPKDTIIADSIKRPELPVWIFGDSLHKSTMDTPPMTIERIYASIRGVKKEFNKTPNIIFFDYIQDIPVPTEKDRYMQVSSAMRLVKRLAIQIKCPIVLGIQAKQEVDDRKEPIPVLRDAEWSAVIGQKLDVSLSLWRPIRTFLPHQRQMINVGGREYVNNESLFVVKLLKQRFEKGYGIWAYDFDPAQMQIKNI